MKLVSTVALIESSRIRLTLNDVLVQLQLDVACGRERVNFRLKA